MMYLSICSSNIALYISKGCIEYTIKSGFFLYMKHFIRKIALQMMSRKLLRIVVLIVIALPIALSKNKTSKEWANSAQKTVWEVSQVFHRATIGLSSFDAKASPILAQLSKHTAKVAGVFGVFGAVFSIVMAFIPGSESPELKLMKSEFGKLSQKVDTIARSLDDTKELIQIEAQRAAFIGHEQKIHHGYSQLERCLQKLDDVLCADLNECKRKKALVAEGFITSMDVQQNVEAILRGTTTDSAFGESLLDLLKDESECNVPKIILCANKVTALITKGMTVSMFYDLMTKPDYNVLDGTVLADKMLRELDNRLQYIQHQCFKEINDWMPLDIENLHEMFSSDIQHTNTKLLRVLKTKYPWIWWHVVTYKGDEDPATGPSGSIRRRFYSSSKEHKVHSFVIPTNTAKVGNSRKKRIKWTKIIQTISTDPKEGVNDIENRLNGDILLENKIQSFALLSGEDFILGHYKDNITQQTLLLNDVVSTNVYVTVPKQRFVVVVSFLQAEYPPNCTETETCNDHGKCYVVPYSTKVGCRCNPGYSGEQCNSSGTSLTLKSVINSMLLKTMKLPTFASIQQSIEDTQLYFKTSTENIQETITKLGERIDEQFKSLGESMSNKFELFCTLSKYKEAIENLNYFHSISTKKISSFYKNISIATVTSKKGKRKICDGRRCGDS